MGTRTKHPPPPPLPRLSKNKDAGPLQNEGRHWLAQKAKEASSHNFTVSNPRNNLYSLASALSAHTHRPPKPSRQDHKINIHSSDRDLHASENEKIYDPNLTSFSLLSPPPGSPFKKEERKKKTARDKQAKAGCTAKEGRTGAAGGRAGPTHTTRARTSLRRAGRAAAVRLVCRLILGRFPQRLLDIFRTHRAVHRPARLLRVGGWADGRAGGREGGRAGAIRFDSTHDFDV